MGKSTQSDIKRGRTAPITSSTKVTNLEKHTHAVVPLSMNLMATSLSVTRSFARTTNADAPTPKSATLTYFSFSLSGSGGDVPASTVFGEASSLLNPLQNTIHEVVQLSSLQTSVPRNSKNLPLRVGSLLTWRWQRHFVLSQALTCE